jgi:hypothetical protein
VKGTVGRHYLKTFHSLPIHILVFTSFNTQIHIRVYSEEIEIERWVDFRNKVPPSLVTISTYILSIESLLCMLTINHDFTQYEYKYFNQQPIQCVQSAPSPLIKQQGCEADHKPTPSAEVKDDGAIFSLPHVTEWHSVN